MSPIDTALENDIALFADSVREWIADNAPLSAQRPRGAVADRQRWQAMRELGWSGLTVAAEHAGAGLGLAGLCAAMQVLGSALLPAPLPSIAIAQRLLESAGSAQQQTRWLPRLGEGAVIALAIDEGARHAPHALATTAHRHGEGWRLAGGKRMVVDAGIADALIVVATLADTPARVALFIVDAVKLKPVLRHAIDERDYADLPLDGVELPADALLGGVAVAFDVLDAALDVGRIGLAAEMCGAGTRALELIVEHLRTRKQFGRAIGEFQALQHRAALIKVDLELAQSALAAAIVAGPAGLAAAASLAKTMAGEALHRASLEIVQMHGGMGMTDEHVAGLFLKRARVAEALYGNRAFHAARWADLHHY